MKYLLDTHTFIWGCEESDRLSETAKRIINDADDLKHFSIASVWEFSIKLSLKKLRFEGGLPRLFSIITKYGLTILPIKEAYLENVINMPFFHRDPFDRMLIATAKADGMTILTADENIQKYDVSTLW